MEALAEMTIGSLIKLQICIFNAIKQEILQALHVPFFQFSIFCDHFLPIKDLK